MEFWYREKFPLNVIYLLIFKMTVVAFSFSTIVITVAVIKIPWPKASKGKTDLFCLRVPGEIKFIMAEKAGQEHELLWQLESREDTFYTHMGETREKEHK